MGARSELKITRDDDQVRVLGAEGVDSTEEAIALGEERMRERFQHALRCEGLRVEPEDIIVATYTLTKTQQRRLLAQQRRLGLVGRDTKPGDFAGWISVPYAFIGGRFYFFGRNLLGLDADQGRHFALEHVARATAGYLRETLFVDIELNRYDEEVA